MRTTRNVLDTLRRTPALLQSLLIRTQFEQILLTTLLEWQPGSLSESLRSDAREVLPRHVRFAEDYIRTHADEPITIELLTGLTGVSGRTLYSGFQKFRGITPMRYLRDVRMEHARSDLQDPARPHSVTEVATRWDFFQLGRFASEYRKRYGECPATTLRRTS
ncbi:helix-turn-helix transcriptional regulator [Aromatoleum toluolicum]|uniref:helix-turn-helix transcriptional regulator n=1 Tax=Aromatoleum toluolicum TaxID=90060 RepID=UPI00210ACFB9|nr:helix-turn-helix transcriptional regulator [Aromatoleum toluolicum]MCQ6963977.1 helix-turn-helix transcriptional regulator [Aromatoleum toluolicum]